MCLLILTMTEIRLVWLEDLYIARFSYGGDLNLYCYYFNLNHKIVQAPND